MDHFYFCHGIVALRPCLRRARARDECRSFLFLGNNRYFAHQYSPRASRITVAFPSVPSIISTKCTEMHVYKMETRFVLSRDRQIKGMIQRLCMPKCSEGVTRSVFSVPRMPPSTRAMFIRLSVRRRSPTELSTYIRVP